MQPKFKIKLKKSAKILTESFFGDKQFIQKSAKIEFPDCLNALLPYRYYDQGSSLYFNEITSDKSAIQTCGFILEAAPLVGCLEADLDILANFFNDNLPEGLILQIINYASPRTGNLLDLWQAAREKTGGIYKDLAAK